LETHLFFGDSSVPIDVVPFAGIKVVATPVVVETVDILGCPPDVVVDIAAAHPGASGVVDARPAVVLAVVSVITPWVLGSVVAAVDSLIVLGAVDVIALPVAERGGVPAINAVEVHQAVVAGIVVVAPRVVGGKINAMFARLVGVAVDVVALPVAPALEHGGCGISIAINAVEVHPAEVAVIVVVAPITIVLDPINAIKAPLGSVVAVDAMVGGVAVFDVVFPVARAELVVRLRELGGCGIDLGSDGGSLNDSLSSLSTGCGGREELGGCGMDLGSDGRSLNVSLSSLSSGCGGREE